jgi:5'-3' exonuclease
MRVAIIDGDVMAYQACKPRWMKHAQTREDGVALIRLDANGKKVPLEYTADEDKEYLLTSWETFKRDLQKLVEDVFADTFVMAVKGSSDFRKRIFPGYKMHRKDTDYGEQLIRFVTSIRELAVIEELAIRADGREADDLLRIWAEEARANGHEIVICTIDKDLKCIPGLYHNTKKGTTEEISEFEATLFYYKQLLMGDATDGIPGIKGVGPKTADRLLKDVSSESEMQAIVVEQYAIAYGEQWLNQLLTNGKLIHLQRNFDDYFTCRHWPAVKIMEEII